MPTIDLRQHSAAGYVYLWVLLFLALASLGLVSVVEIQELSQRRSKEAELLAIGRQYRDAIASYLLTSKRSDIDGYPKNLEDLLLDERSGVQKRHLRKIFVDPMTGKAEWGLIMRGGRIIGIHSLSEQKPIKQFNGPLEGVDVAEKGRYADWIFSYP